ncbi:MAG: hypothetical protein GY820_19085 [Gammaproteobacteria bacterium]|nr:hypothetical protein [Gammaproteobacteria bacterium]
MIITAFQYDGRLFLTHTNYQARTWVTVGGYLTIISLWLTHDFFADESFQEGIGICQGFQYLNTKYLALTYLFIGRVSGTVLGLR